MLLQPGDAFAADKPLPEPGPALSGVPPTARGTPAKSTEAAAIEAQTVLYATCVKEVKAIKQLNKQERELALVSCVKSGGGSAVTAKAAIAYTGTYDHCVDSTKTLCASPDIRHFVRIEFDVSNTAPLTVRTVNLLPIGASNPDTVLYVMKCDDWSCTKGEIVGVDDDGNTDPDSNSPLDSKVTIAQPTPGPWVAFVLAYSSATLYEGRGGTATVGIAANGQAEDPTNDQVFADWQVHRKELRTNDVLVVAKNPGNPSMTTTGYANYHDSMVLVLSDATVECDVNCGRFQFQDDTSFGADASTYLSRLVVGAELGSPTSARIAVGAYNNGKVAGTELFRINGRLAHVRRHTAMGGAWSGTAQADADSDGLPAEVESQLGSCDAAATDPDPAGGADVIVQGWTCDAARDWINGKVDEHDNSQPLCAQTATQAKCWRPSDSDHDGIDDGAEFFAVAVGCDEQPSGPYRQPVGCTKPNPILGSCASGNQMCAVEPKGGAQALASPFFDQEPTTWDVFVEADYFRSTVFAESATAHTLTAGHLAGLANMWGAEPGKCWDNTDGPNGPTGLCLGGTDLKYRTAIHAYPGQGVAVGDDRFQEEMPARNGAEFSRSHAYGRFGGAMRYADVAGYSLAWHDSNPSAVRGTAYERHFWWGNATGTPGYERASFSHELGHNLGLRNGPDEGHFFTKPDPECCGDGLACNSYQQGCGTAAAQVPVPSSPMAYHYMATGAFPIGVAPPAATTASSACSQQNLRFSKGLLGALDEQVLYEIMTPSAGWAEWQLRYLAQQLFCYRPLSFSAVPNAGPFAWRPSGAAPEGPFCTVDGAGQATECRFNWTSASLGANAASSSPKKADITTGRWTGQSSSDMDEIRDRDEWAKIIALGRQRLKPETNPEICLHATTFNGGVATDNFCGWPGAVVAQNVAVTQATYPTGGCQGTCSNGGICKRDTCTPATVATDCRLPTASCDWGECTCSADIECLSGQCIGGKCVTAWGGCSCTLDTQCAGAGGFCDAGYCRGWVDAQTAQAPNNSAIDPAQPYPVLESASFNGVTSRIQLEGATNPQFAAASGAYNNSFTARFDFRFEGFGPGQTSQAVVGSGAFGFGVSNVNGQPVVTVTAGSHTALTIGPITKGRWYRVVWAAQRAGTADHYVWLRPWNESAGWYGPGDLSTDCKYQTWANDLPAPGDVWIGHDGTSNTSNFFRGRIDNLSIVNYRYANRPSSCSVQQ